MVNLVVNCLSAIGYQLAVVSDKHRLSVVRGWWSAVNQLLDINLLWWVINIILLWSVVDGPYERLLDKTLWLRFRENARLETDILFKHCWRSLHWDDMCY